MGRVLIFVTTSVALASGCHKTFHAKGVQPNPLVSPDETLNESRTLEIVTGDMDLRVPVRDPQSRGYGAGFRTRRLPLRNRASFVVVSKNRVRFSVWLEHKWQQLADPTNGWKVTLVDDRGFIYVPTRVDRVKPKLLVQMWDREVVSTGQAASGLGFNSQSVASRSPLGSLAVFRGKADFEFTEENIFRKDAKSIALVLSRRGTAFVFQWRFEDDGSLREVAAN